MNACMRYLYLFGFIIFTDEVALCINCKNKKEKNWEEKGEEWKKQSALAWST